MIILYNSPYHQYMLSISSLYIHIYIYIYMYAYWILSIYYSYYPSFFGSEPYWNMPYYPIFIHPWTIPFSSLARWSSTKLWKKREGRGDQQPCASLSNADRTEATSNIGHILLFVQLARLTEAKPPRFVWWWNLFIQPLYFKRVMWWNMMKCDEIWWNMMNYDEIWWNVMKSDEI